MDCQLKQAAFAAGSFDTNDSTSAAYGDPNAEWHILGKVLLDGEEPNWRIQHADDEDDDDE